MIECGYPERIPIFTEQQYKDFINQWNGKKNIYRSVYSFSKFKNHKPDYDTININQIFFDFDNIEETYSEVLNFVKKLKEDNIKFRINFSGGGIHVYIVVQPQNINPKIYLMHLHNHIIDKYHLKGYDSHVIGDIKRLRRIENTLNIKYNLYCIYLTFDELISGLDKIKELAKTPRNGKYYWSEGEPLNIDIHNDIEINENHSIDIKFKELLTLPEPCILRILHIKHPSHEERFLLCLWLSNQFRNGKDINTFDLNNLSERIITQMRSLGWDDYSESLVTAKSTRYQVLNIIGKKYNFVPGCSWRKQHGICQSDYCYEKV